MQKVLTLFCAAGQPAWKRPATVAAKPAASASQPVPAQPVAAVAVPAARASVAAPAGAAQSLFQVGSNALNLGAGFGLGHGYLSGATTATPAMSLSYMRGAAQVGPGIIGAGRLISYQSFGWEDARAKAPRRNFYVGAAGPATTTSATASSTPTPAWAWAW